MLGASRQFSGCSVSFVYVQKTGSLYLPNRKKMAVGYSGHGKGLNQPDWQDRVGIGPIPVGRYIIGPAHTPVDHLGAMAFPLVPAKTNDMHGRSAFFVHGDNPALNHTASNGCIILAPGFRAILRDSQDRGLIVVAEESDVDAAFATIHQGTAA